MYCSNCGNKNDGNNFCTKCGNKLDNIDNKDIVKNNGSGLKTASIVLGIIGIVGTFMIIFSPICFIISLVGLILSVVASRNVRNVSGIILNSVGLFLSIIVLGIIGLVSFFVIEEYDRLPDYKDNNSFDNGYYEKFKDLIEEY